MCSVLDVCRVLGWSVLESERLKDYILVAEAFNISIDDIRDHIKASGYDISDSNSWFYIVFDKILSEITNMARKELEILPLSDDEKLDIELKLEGLEEYFSPHISGKDSHFNNILDRILSPRKTAKEMVIELIEGLKEENKSVEG